MVRYVNVFHHSVGHTSQSDTPLKPIRVASRFSNDINTEASGALIRRQISSCYLNLSKKSNF